MKKLTCCDSCGGSLKMLGNNYIKCNYCGQIYTSVKDGEWCIMTADEVYQKAVELQQQNNVEGSYIAADMFESLGKYNDSNIKAVACLDNIERIEAEEEEKRLAAIRKAEEEKRLEEERKAAEAKRLEEERKAEEARKLEEMRKAEEARKLEEMRKAEEEKKMAAARLAEEAERAEQLRIEREERRQKAQQTRKSVIRIALIAVAIVACVLIVSGVMESRQKAQNEKYITAVANYEDGKYDQALTQFKELGDYEDSKNYVSSIEKLATEYNDALAKFEANELGVALEKFKALGAYKDAADRVAEIEQLMADSQATYEEAVALFEAKSYSNALEKFMSIRFYQDSEEQINAIAAELVKEANEYLAKADYSGAESVVAMIPEDCAQYEEGVAILDKIAEAKQAEQDAATLQASYEDAISTYNSGDYITAQSMFAALGEYEDSANYLDLIGESIYEQAEKLYDDGELAACVTEAQYIDEASEWEDAQKAVTLIQNAKSDYAATVKEEAEVVLREEGYSAFTAYVNSAVCDLYSKEEATVYCESYKPVSLLDVEPSAEPSYINIDAFYRYQGNWEDEYVYTDASGKTYEYGMNRISPNFSTVTEESYVEYDVTDYSYITGTLILNEYCKNSKEAGQLVIYGDDREIYTSPDVKNGFEPLYISVDITECSILRFEFTGSYSNPSLVEPSLSK